MNTLNQSRDRLAKLLATENIAIVRSNVATASFDIKNRVLILPRWKEMTDEVEEMLMLHEVGHALFTDKEDYGVVFEKEKSHLRDYANVIEDVRIESKMKSRYPGSRKSFNAGYRQLNERDFFSVKNRNLEELLLIDRINLYFKVGYNCGVKFSPEERPFLRKAEECDTVDDVIRLAQEIYNFSKVKQKESSIDDILLRMKQEEEFEESEEDSYNDYESYEEDLLEEEEYNRDVRNSGANHVSEGEDETDDLMPETYKSLEKNLEQLADQHLIIEYFTPDFEYTFKNEVIIPYKKILEDHAHQNDELFTSREHIQKFKSSTSSIVNYLIKEFEMKKSATAYKRSKISKLGILDSQKLYAYKLKDDLFKQIMRVENGKKHGMIFLLDWSGSMINCIQETIEQVINLAMFCQRIQIPYQVFAFTDGYKKDQSYEETCRTPTMNKNGMSSTTHFNLFEFFSHKMTNVEFNKMVSCLLTHPWTTSGYGLNGTPLNEALLYMTSYVGKFIKNNQVEKMSFITLTDGDGSPLTNSNKAIKSGNYYDYKTNSRYNKKCIIQDPITKKDYDLSDDATQQTEIFLNIIRDRWNTNNTGFYLMANSYRNANTFIRDNIGIRGNEQAVLCEKIVSSMRRNKYCILNNVPGRNEFYLLSNNIKIEDDVELGVNDTMSSGQISRQFTKLLNGKRVSRVVLSKFVEQVA